MYVTTPVILRGIFLLLLVALLCPAGLAHGVDEDPVSIWGCPMCETVRTEEPGSCPICKMALVDMSPAARARLVSQVKKVNGVTAVVVTPDGVKPVLLEQSGGSVPLMPGAPVWIFYATSITILLL